MSPVAAHRAAFERLSMLDRRLEEAGVSADRRRALWSALDEDPMVANGAVPAGMRRDLALCRAARDQAAALDDAWRASSVYEALLAFFFLCVDGDDFVFRGHLDASWRLVPSFFRMTPRLNPMLHAHAVYGMYRAVEKRIGRPLALTPFQAEAAAQHYGAGTTLLDVTSSMRIAAYFATTVLRPGDSRGDVGAVYVLSVRDLERAGRKVLRAEEMPAELVRLRTTKAAFISGWNYDLVVAQAPVRDVGDIAAWFNQAAGSATALDEAGLGIEAALAAGRLEESAIIRFRQTGDSFEDPTWGVTRRRLGDGSGDDARE